MLRKHRVVVLRVSGDLLSHKSRKFEGAVGVGEFQFRNHKAAVPAVEFVDFPFQTVAGRNYPSGFVDAACAATFEYVGGVCFRDRILPFIAGTALVDAFYSHKGFVAGEPDPYRPFRTCA